jgi:hypothetical protein
MPKVLGVIAEEYSDVEVVRELARIISPTRRPPKIKRFVGHGCGRIKSKCRQWAELLYEQGCQSLILIQDLDDCELVNL